MTLSSQEIERYARQIVLHGLGGPGQNKLKAARALVIGAGGLGSPALQYLAGAGVGTLGIIDDDVVSLSNLHRQVIHTTDDVGRPKTDSARAAVARINPHVVVEPIALRLDDENAQAIVRRFDVVLDGSDNFATRYALSDACFHERRPLVSAALGEFDGTLTTLKPYEDGPDGTQSLDAFAATHHLAANTDQAQLAFIVYDLRTGYAFYKPPLSGTLQSNLQSAPDPEPAATMLLTGTW